ncbi:MAG TPA: J domain-containing protein [Allosphingosinicella sp.]|jgi:hypothetical protein|uniref:J domain-containing protein n=1 Tax=Allosphingosinicella sp. TaxID=2823234 RepID=UPI002F2A8A51
MRKHNRLYTLLNVLPDAEPVVIEAAYKALMKRHHPDIQPGGAAVGERTATELNQAYQTLRDPERRAAYDAQERARQERDRAELARAFQPPSPRATPPPPHRPEPVRAGQRAAAWIGAAGILMLGGAIYLLAQGSGTPAARVPASSGRVAATSPALAAQAFRDQPVNRSQVEKAVAEFRRIAGEAGMPGAAAYSDHCFDVQSRTGAVTDFDHCVAFDHLASRGDLVESQGEATRPARFQPQALVARHIQAAEAIARDPSLIEARLFEIRRLTDNEVGRIATAAPASRPSDRAATRPLARAPVQRSPTPKRARPQPRSSQRPNPARSPSEQDFLEREGGIY